MRSAQRLAFGFLFVAICIAGTLAMGTELGEGGRGLARFLAVSIIGVGLTGYMFGWLPALALSVASLGLAVRLYAPLERIRAGKPHDLVHLGIYLALAGGLIWWSDCFRKRLRETTERYRLVAEGASDGILITDADGNYLWANVTACQMFGYTRVEMFDLNLRQLIELGGKHADGHPSMGVCVEHSLLEECRGQRKDGSALVVELSGKVLSDGTLMALLRDVTERKRAEEQIKASLREKEILLREIHHRVKNNLQVISSLLALQSRQLEDPHARAEFTSALERVKSIALLHEKLSLSQDLARIDFAGYIRSLACELSSTYQLDTGAVTLNLALAEVSLDLEKAMPCGLIVSELVSNAMKYAFPGRRRGEIHVGLGNDAGRTVTLSVRDTGVGLPEGTHPGHTESLGLSLVNTLTRQLKGSLEVRRNGGTEFRITFPGNSHGGDETHESC